MVNSPGLASLNSLSGLRAVGVAATSQAPGSGVIKTKEYCFLGCMGQIEEVWLGVRC